MEVKDLVAGQGKIDIELDIVDMQEPRTFNKFGKEGKVANGTGKDATGQVKITFWNEQADQVKDGDKIKITNGYVSEWQGEKQLSTGKFGQLEVIGKSEASAETAPQKEEKKVEGEEELMNLADEEEVI